MGRGVNRTQMCYSLRMKDAEKMQPFTRNEYSNARQFHTGGFTITI